MYGISTVKTDYDNIGWLNLHTSQLNSANFLNVIKFILLILWFVTIDPYFHTIMRQCMILMNFVAFVFLVFIISFVHKIQQLGHSSTLYM